MITKCGEKTVSPTHEGIQLYMHLPMTDQKTKEQSSISWKKHAKGIHKKTSHDVFLFQKQAPSIFLHFTFTFEKTNPHNWFTKPRNCEAAMPTFNMFLLVENHEGESLGMVGWEKNLVKPETSSLKYDEIGTVGLVVSRN